MAQTSIPPVKLTASVVDAAIRRAQAMVRQYAPEGAIVVDELIAERRSEAAKE